MSILKIQKIYESHGPKTIILIQVGSFFEVYGILYPDGSYKDYY